MTGDALLELRSVSVRRGRRTVLADVDLALHRGDAMHLTGANGSGKTSLLRTAVGLAPPRRGAVRRTGRCAFVPEQLRLAPALRGAEWLEAMRRLHGAPPVDWRAEAAATGLDPAVLHAPSATLSKGMLQRLALLDAVHCRADVLVLDEPFTGLDAGARDWLAARLGDRLAAGGAAVLLTDHDGAMRGRLAPTATVHLADGRAAPDAPPAERRATVRVVASHADGRRAAQDVPADAVDARLRALLDEGWHIERVAP
ncbi:ABC transporter [Baekduia alba]|uniref:ABC transporter ATP-binding protein n=1 Tax=Baekduia alba TaxID=2997333 RepID=UPI002340B5D0|nr:ATP-binding cassette domain-containing protein [Baekduia alba]WCB93166.1 ABC transporter [Baekduia alba]